MNFGLSWSKTTKLLLLDSLLQEINNWDCLRPRKTKLHHGPPRQTAKGASPGKVLLLHGRSHRCEALQYWLDGSLGSLLSWRLPWTHWTRGQRDHRQLGVGGHLVHRQHRSLWSCRLWDDEDEEDLASPRLDRQRLRRCCRRSQLYHQLCQPVLVCGYLDWDDRWNNSVLCNRSEERLRRHVRRPGCSRTVHGGETAGQPCLISLPSSFLLSPSSQTNNVK